MQKTDTDRLVLVVDDEPLMLAFIQKTLVAEGYRVITAGDGVYALSLVRDNNPDMILLDIRMPGPDGIMTLRRIREISEVPVIMVTGLGSDDMIEKAIDSGADDYICKPFRPNELLARIKAKLRRL